MNIAKPLYHNCAIVLTALYHNCAYFETYKKAVDTSYVKSEDLCIIDMPLADLYPKNNGEDIFRVPLSFLYLY